MSAASFRARRLLLIAALGTAFSPGPAAAQLAQGADIRTNDYNVDLYQGPVLASTRVTGLAGAYVAIAEGVDGVAQNPAAPAVRVPYSFSHFDLDFGVSAGLPTVLESTDFFNTGDDRTGVASADEQDVAFASAAANLQFGAWGFGLSADGQTYRLNRSTGAREQLSGTFGVVRALVARGFADGQLVIGAGARIITLDVVDPEAQGDDARFSSQGVGGELGMVWMPAQEQFRIGAAFRSAVRTRTDTPGEVLFQGTPDELWLPDEVTVPWDANLGLALQFGPRPLNPRWIDPSSVLDPLESRHDEKAAHRERQRERGLAEARAGGRDLAAAERAIDAELDTQAALDELELERAAGELDRKLRERYRKLERFYVLVSAALLMTGPAGNAVGVESFLQRKVNRSGKTLVLSPRLGIESELVPNWVKLRLGTYGEPTRFDTARAGGRLHGTFGFDLKLFSWTVFGLFHESTEWRVSGALDAAERYLNSAASIGIWH